MAIKEFAFANDLSFFDIRNHEGFLRTLIIRTASTGENMIIVTFYHEDIEKREALLNHLANKFPKLLRLCM